MRNLNIKSDKVYADVEFIAKRTGKTLTAAVAQAVANEKRRLTKDELIAKWKRIGEQNRQTLPPEFLNWDYDADLYDEWGLPK